MTFKVFKAQKKLLGRVLILEDDAVMGEWLGMSLARHGIESHWVNNLKEAVEVFGENTEPRYHAVVTDIYMNKGDLGGLELLRQSAQVDIPVCVITSNVNLEIAKEALKRGAFSLLEKPFPITELTKQLFQTWQEPKFLSALLERFMEVHQLTKKEREVCRLLFKGLSNKEIASVLKVTEKTIKFHVTSIFGKFRVSSRSELSSSIFSI